MRFTPTEQTGILTASAAAILTFGLPNPDWIVWQLIRTTAGISSALVVAQQFSPRQDAEADEMQTWWDIKAQQHDAEKLQLISHYEAELMRWQQHIQQEREQFQQTLNARHQQLDDREVQLEIATQQFQQEKLNIYQYLDEQHQQQEQAQQEAQAALESRKTQLEQDLETKRSSIQEQFINEWNILRAKTDSEIEQYQHLIHDLESQKQRLIEALHSLQQPDRFDGISPDELIGDRIIDYLYQYGIIVRNPTIKPLSAHKRELSFNVQAIAPGYDPNDEFSHDLLSAYKRLNDIKTGLKAIVPNCRTIPTTDLKNSQITVTIDISGIDRDAPKNPIKAVAPDYLLHVASASNHFRLSGPTDSGKSTLADNLIGALSQTFGGFRVVLLDPKYPFSEWTTFNPNYKGFRDCLNGIAEIGDRVDARLEEAKRLVEQGKPIPDYEPELIAVDELEVLYDEALVLDDYTASGKSPSQKKLIQSLRKGLKVGRGLTKAKGNGIKVMYVTQSPLCSRIGLNRDDFDQSSNIWLGENIPRALSEELQGKISTGDRDDCLQQYHLRVNAGEQYVGLFKLPSKRPFIAPLPLPGAYSLTHTDLPKSDSNRPTSPEIDLEKLWDLDSDDYPDDEAA